MNKQNSETRRKLKDLYEIKQLEDLLERTTLDSEQKQICMLHYGEGKTLGYIADLLGMSESTVKRKHKGVLMKIGKLF